MSAVSPASYQVQRPVFAAANNQAAFGNALSDNFNPPSKAGAAALGGVTAATAMGMATLAGAARSGKTAAVASILSGALGLGMYAFAKPAKEDVIADDHNNVAARLNYIA